MKKVLFTLLALALLIGFPQAAQASFEDGEVLPARTVAPLMAWVEMHTGVRVPHLPQVIASKSSLTKIVSRMGPLAGHARALYTRGTVVLDHRLFDLEDDIQVSLLVHELVHYAQAFKHEAGWQCAQSKEVEAYTLQNQWLEERDHAPFVRASWIKRMAACPVEENDTAIASVQ